MDKAIKKANSDRDNYIDLSSLPRYQKGNIRWCDVLNIKVPFSYNGIAGYITLVKPAGSDKYGSRIMTIKYNKKNNNIRVDSLVNCRLRNIVFPNRGKYYFSIGQVIPRKKGGSLQILSREKKHIQYAHSSSLKRMYHIICLNIDCGNIYDADEERLLRGDGCPVCSKGRVKIGINDLFTKYNEFATYLVNKEDGYNHSINYQRNLLFFCPCCNSKIKQVPYHMKTVGFYCPFCGDGVSYPNKFIGNLLLELSIPFEYEKRFDWCKFRLPNSSKFSYGVYDIVIEKKKLILELDGGLGHGISTHSKSKMSLEETAYRDYQKEILASQNGYKLIRIDANYQSYRSRKEHLIKSTKEALSDIFDLSTINWNRISEKAQNSIVIEAINLYESGKSIKDICTILNRSDHAIYEYLRTGHELGICSYIPRTRFDYKYYRILLEEYKRKSLRICDFAKKLGVSRQTIYKHLKKDGVWYAQL